MRSDQSVVTVVFPFHRKSSQELFLLLPCMSACLGYLCFGLRNATQCGDWDACMSMNIRCRLLMSGWHECVDDSKSIAKQIQKERNMTNPFPHEDIGCVTYACQTPSVQHPISVDQIVPLQAS